MAEILTKQRYEKYAHDGYLYVLDRLNSDGSLVFWRCDKRWAGCKGRIHTTAGADRAFVKMVTQHTCADTGNAARVGVQTAISAVRRRAVETMEIPSVITAEITQHLPRAVKGQLNSTDAIRKIVQKIRKKERDEPVIPENRAALVIPNDFAEIQSDPGFFP